MFLISEEFSDCYRKCTYVYVFMQSTRYSCQMSMKLEFCGHIFETQISNFVKIRAVGVELFHACGRTDGETDGHDETTRFSQFCERA